MKFSTKPYDTTQLTLGMLLHYLGKLKIQIFCKCGRKRKQLHFNRRWLYEVSVNQSDTEYKKCRFWCPQTGWQSSWKPWSSVFTGKTSTLIINQVSKWWKKSSQKS